MPSHLMGSDAVAFLKSYGPENFCSLFSVEDVDQQSLFGIYQGPNMAWSTVTWLASLRWPPDCDEHYRRHDDWGISWLELVFSFVLFSHKYPPIKGGGQKQDALFWDYCSPEGLVQPPSSRSVTKMYYTFQKMILAIRTLTGVNLFPNFKEKSCTSLKRFGFHGACAGVPCRPSLPNSQLTCQHVHQYVSRLNGSLACSLPVKLLESPIPFDQGPLVENCMIDRHKTWLKIVNARYNIAFELVPEVNLCMFLSNLTRPPVPSTEYPPIREGAW